MRRRTFLLASGSSLAALSGCLGGDDGRESMPEESPTPAETPTEEPALDEPEDFVEEYNLRNPVDEAVVSDIANWVHTL